jgi:hypothetical protein
MAALEAGAPARALETVPVATVAGVMAHIAAKPDAVRNKRVIVVFLEGTARIILRPLPCLVNRTASSAIITGERRLGNMKAAAFDPAGHVGDSVAVFAQGPTGS